ncbi:hypothetical protein QTN47_02690 [Danxiaibacter flavus]|uniref:O-antigen ligase domain-containing protein n=1 Tax=Danxiaibacter flavus TaxID=3049108 RepID=A0ABV3Z934_9BACT|nr:hypothetical protein QNM32_02690 [Chitinophagaceae bacterium DXS]
MNNAIKAASRKFVNSIDWKLLVFLLLFLNVKLIVKLAAVILAYVFRPGFSLGIKKTDRAIPLFYFLLIVIACFNFLLFKDFTNLHYDIVFITGIGFWLLCLLAVNQVRIAAMQNPPEKTHNTLLVFFITNCVASFIRLATIILDAGALNPYRYQGMYQKYFIGTGDLIRGITFDTSTTNAVICAAGVVYFLCRKQALMTLLCMATLLLTGSNFTNLALIAVMIYLFAFRSDRLQKSLMVICCMLLVVFMAKISPQNDTYATGIIKKLFSKNNYPGLSASNTSKQITAEPTDPEAEKKAFAKHYLDSISMLLAKLEAKSAQSPDEVAVGGTVPVFSERPEIPQPSIHSQPFQRKKDTLTEQRVLINYIQHSEPANNKVSAFPEKYPGKLISFIQTGNYFKLHPGKMLTGNGMGKFSSKLAFRATALNISGGYPSRFSYVNNDFRDNHLATFLNFFSKDAEMHSVVNTPNSVYNQLMGEYGLMGIAAFVFAYIFYWIGRFKKGGFGFPLLLLLCAIFFVDYWFEQLSIVVLFELMMFLDIKEEKTAQRTKAMTWKDQVLQY